MVESACGLGCLVLGWFLGSSFLSPPSVFSSLPSTMTWAPCPHGVRTRGKKKFSSTVQEHVRTYMLAGRGEQLLVALQNHGNPAVCKTCRVPAETIETCTIFCPAAKILLTKRPPFRGPFLDPKTGAKSPGHKQIKLRLNEWTPFWGPFLDPKTGVVLSAKLWSPSEKKHKFRLFLHVRDRSFPYRWVSRALQRRECLFSTPCEHLCPHMFLNWGGPPWRHRFC